MPRGFAPAGLEFMAGRHVDSFTAGIGGRMRLVVPVLGEVPLASAHVLYSHPGFFEFGGGLDFSPGPLFKITGGIDGFIDLDRGLFNLEGRVEACAGGSIKLPVVGRIKIYVCEGVEGVVSSRGIGFCLHVTVPIFDRISFGAGYRWGDALPGLHLFTCDIGDYREARPAGARGAQAGSHSFTLEKGLPSAEIRVIGQGGLPGLTLTGPGGKQIAITPGDEAPSGDNFIVLEQPETNTLYIALRKPAAGRYTVTHQAGTAAIRSVAAANGLQTPKVGANVTGRGFKRVLHYRVRTDSGQSVTFAEEGDRSYNILGRARGESGEIVFTPADGARESRKIVALVERGGVVKYALDVARYRAPGPIKPGRPGRLRVRRKRSSVRISWSRAQGARQYGVVLQLSNGQRVFRLVRKRRVTLRGVNPEGRGRVSVRGLSTTGRRGPAAKKKLARL